MERLNTNCCSTTTSSCVGRSRRRPWRGPIVVISTVVCCIGCISTYTAGSDESPDGAYVVFGHIRGAGGRAYIDNTEKTVFITIEAKGTQKTAVVTNYQNGTVVSESVVAVSGKPGKPLLEKQYLIRGSDVCWDDVWGKDDNVTVFLYDYGPGVSSYDAKKNGTPKRQILTVNYRFDSKTGSFVEQR
jgi:hypothetical protein